MWCDKSIAVATSLEARLNMEMEELLYFLNVTLKSTVRLNINHIFMFGSKLSVFMFDSSHLSLIFIMNV